MKLLIFACLVASSFGQLVYHANGAVTPYHHANAVATANHLAGNLHYFPSVYHYGKREAEADPQLIAYSNGAVVPAHHANIAATNAHLLSKGAFYHHPAVYGHGVYYGKREAEADAQEPYQPANAVAAANPMANKSLGKREAEADPQLITYTNGAVVPAHHANIAATNAHLLSKGVVYPYAAHGIIAHPFLVAHPNGAVVPVEPADVVKARADHLAAKAAA